MLIFKMNYRGYEKQARELILKKKFVKPEELALMSDWEVEKVINDNYKTFSVGEDWLLVPNDKYKEFCEMITWIYR